jgi:hypothetical protein
MTNFSAYILGLDPKMIKDQPVASRMKVLNLSLLLLLPVIVWFISGLLIACELMGASLTTGLITGSVCALVIFIIDRSFITAFGQTNTKWMFALRIVFALLSGILGSTALDTTIFKEDIKSYQEKTAQADYQAEKDSFMLNKKPKLIAAEEYLRQSSIAFDEARQGYMDEMDGKGSGIPGKGDVADAKEIVMKDAKATQLKAKQELDTLNAQLEREAHLHAATLSSKGANTLLEKVKDLHDFAFQDRTSGFFYALFFLLVLMIETMLIFFKMGAGSTVLEEAILAEENIRRQKLLAMKREQDRYDRAVGIMGEESYREVVRLTRGN